MQRKELDNEQAEEVESTCIAEEVVIDGGGGGVRG